MKNILRSYQDSLRYLQNFLEDEKNLAKTKSVAAKLADTLLAGGKAISCGNGGSMCDAMHFAEEFTGRFCNDRPALPAIALSDPSYLTCVGNDYGFEQIFSRGVAAYGQKGDFLVAISTSGNSANVLAAVQEAKKRGMYCVGFLGKDGGKLLKECHEYFLIPAATSDRVQEVHMVILHIIIQEVERILYPQNYAE